MVKVVESSPVVVCQVKILEDDDDQTLPMTQLSEATVQLFKDLVSLNVKMQSLPVRYLCLDADVCPPRGGGRLLPGLHISHQSGGRKLAWEQASSFSFLCIHPDEGQEQFHAV